MRRSAAALAAASVAVLLAACSGESADTAGAAVSPTPTAAATAPTPTPSPSPTKSADAACGAVAGTDLLRRIPDAILAIGADLSGEQLDELLAINAELGAAIDVAPPEIAAPLRSLQLPFQQVQDVVDAGGGDLNMDTSHVAEDVTAFMGACVDAGFTIDK